MLVFSDLHHSGLYASFHYLFEERLGHKLYRPIGTEWYSKGYWDIAKPYGDDAGTIAQFLALGTVPDDGSPGLNESRYFVDDVHYIWDGVHEYHQKAVTLDKFLSMDFDIIIASIPAHVRTYRRLINAHKLRAKLIYHIGNIAWHTKIPYDEVNNLMISVKEFSMPKDKNVVFYRQEFSEDIFYPAQEPYFNMVTSFVNCLPNHEYFCAFKGLMEPDYDVKAYGIECPDGIVSGIAELAAIMRKSKFGFHNKPYGDGYGHVIHNWFASGRPVLVNMGDYKDKLAGELMEDGKTCIDIDRKSPLDLAGIVRGLSDLEYADMTTNVRAKYKEVVDFTRDAENVRKFLERMI